VLPKYCFGNPDLLVGTRLITLSRNGVPVAEKKTPERHKKMNRNGVPVAKRRTGTPFRCVPVHFEPCPLHLEIMMSTGHPRLPNEIIFAALPAGVTNLQSYCVKYVALYRCFCKNRNFSNRLNEINYSLFVQQNGCCCRTRNLSAFACDRVVSFRYH
jgi:hypothetical protein